jgi:hypothetical protein
LAQPSRYFCHAQSYLKGHQLIEISAAVNHGFFINRHARRAHLQALRPPAEASILAIAASAALAWPSRAGSAVCVSAVVRCRFCDLCVPQRRLRRPVQAPMPSPRFFLIVIVPSQHVFFSYYSSPLLAGFTVWIVQRTGLRHWRWLWGFCSALGYGVEIARCLTVDFSVPVAASDRR